MINFFSETDFDLSRPDDIKKWISSIISSEGYEEGDITFVFCDDPYLNKINVKFLGHDTLTDIISFDDTIGKQVRGEVYISIDRVRENARDYEVDFRDELHRVMIHGILHFCKYNDKTSVESRLIRRRENLALLKLKIT
ncbi:MAG: rRNA maturation RNase YbeY [Bacteroidetes bacterium]|nr:MAG: rRNA maturation RNase YbeY [Bacteroidota bacterium]